jgi:hypothetical protein
MLRATKIGLSMGGTAIPGGPGSDEQLRRKQTAVRGELRRRRMEDDDGLDEDEVMDGQKAPRHTCCEKDCSLPAVIDGLCRMHHRRREQRNYPAAFLDSVEKAEKRPPQEKEPAMNNEAQSGTCRMPGCSYKVRCRGVCNKHGRLLTAPGAAGDEVRRAALPSRRGRRRSQPEAIARPGTDTARAVTRQTRRPGPRREGASADRQGPVSTILQALAALGITGVMGWTEGDDHILRNTDNGRIVRLCPDGTINALRLVEAE